MELESAKNERQLHYFINPTKEKQTAIKLLGPPWHCFYHLKLQPLVHGRLPTTSLKHICKIKVRDTFAHFHISLGSYVCLIKTCLIQPLLSMQSTSFARIY